jgi:aspartate carbamoyltransferase catalytic subunit
VTSFALLSINDLTDDEIDRILARSHDLSASSPWSLPPSSRVVALLFLETSLRTRLGFATAAARLGWHSVDVFERRQSPTSMVESFEDTLRTVSGLVDVVVARPARALERDALQPHLDGTPLVNGGDTGPQAEHPTQALIDLFAIQRAKGNIGELRIGICGDPRMRAVRSLLLLLGRRPPLALTIFADATHHAQQLLPRSLASLTDFRDLPHVEHLDVLYVAGMPHQSLPLKDREQLIVDQASMSRLPPAAIVLSPMPVIDELDFAVRRDTRVQMFWQSDQSLFVRMAVLEFVVGTRQRGSAFPLAPGG